MGKMRRLACFFLLILFYTCQVSAQRIGYNDAVNRYILKYKDIAIKEMKDYRIPASITLAQGILESDAGRSVLAVEANNHFGIKCHKGWSGMTFYQDDDTKDECFRKYNDPVDSYRDHSSFLTQRDRYKGLFDLEITDYKGWATGLKSAGYATNPAYAGMLIRTIETFTLDRFDRDQPVLVTGDSLDDLENPAKQLWLRRLVLAGKGGGNRNIFENNRLRMIVARKDDDVYVISRDLNIPVGRLLKYNELPYATALRPGQIVYLEHKRRKGAAGYHKVMRGDDLYAVSQLYGVKLKLLYKRNDLQPGVEPKEGVILRLR